MRFAIASFATDLIAFYRQRQTPCLADVVRRAILGVTKNLSDGFAHPNTVGFQRQFVDVWMEAHVCTPNTRAKSNNGITCALSAKGQDEVTGATT